MLKTTINTSEEGLRLAVGFGDMPTPATFPRTVLGIYKYNEDTFFHSFISTEIYQLTKTPRMQIPSLSPSKPNSLSNAFEIFKHKILSIIKGCYELFADNMVNFSTDSFLLPRQPFQELYSSSCALVLERRPDFKRMISNLLQIFNSKFYSIRSGSNCVDSKVNACRLVSSRWWNWFRKNYVKIKNPLSLIPNENSRCRFLVFEKSELIITNRELEILNSALSSRKRDIIVTAHKSNRKGSSIILNRSWSKLVHFMFSFSAGTDSGYSSDNKVGLKVISIFYLPVAKVLDFNFVRCLMLYGYLKDVVTGLSKFKKGIIENGFGFNGDFKPAFNGFYEFHSGKYMT